MTSRDFLLLALLPAIGVAITGCSVTAPEPRTLAAERAARCADESPAAVARVTEPANVESVEPLYGIVYSTPNGQESRLLGAKLRLRSADGQTAESLTHALYCHAATETLRADDACPYWIPDGAVDITVKYETDGYVVQLEGHDFREANEILMRARAFARNGVANVGLEDGIKKC
jgi:hypothetical protein